MSETIWNVLHLTLDHEGGRVVADDAVRAEKEEKIGEVWHGHAEVGRRVRLELRQTKE